MEVLLSFIVEIVLQLLVALPGFLWRTFSHREEERRQEPAGRITVSSVLSGPSRIPASRLVDPGFVTRLGEGTHCQVCGDALEKDVVSCPACATLHHEDCWAYLKGCSTYACRRSA